MKNIITSLLLIATISTFAQTGIGTTTPNTNAQLEVASTTKGFLPPRVALTSTTSASPLAAHVAGMVVYNTATAGDVTPGLYVNSGTAWTLVTASGSNTTFTIGQFYQGGIIFWLDATGQHGLIVAKADYWQTIRWYGGTDSNTRARANGIGAGLKNTAIIIANQGPIDGGTFAATVCNEHRVQVGSVFYGDWYLPSKDELDLMYQNKSIINTAAVANGGSNFVNSRYWSSTESGITVSWAQDFTNGSATSSNLKNYTYYVRAIRAF